MFEQGWKVQEGGQKWTRLSHGWIWNHAKQFGFCKMLFRLPLGTNSWLLKACFWYIDNQCSCSPEWVGFKSYSFSQRGCLHLKSRSSGPILERRAVSYLKKALCLCFPLPDCAPNFHHCQILQARCQVSPHLLPSDSLSSLFSDVHSELGTQRTEKTSRYRLQPPSPPLVPEGLFFGGG